MEITNNTILIKELLLACGIKGTSLEKLCNMNLKLDRVISVIDNAKRNNFQAGYVIKALENNWEITQQPNTKATNNRTSASQDADINCPLCHGTGMVDRWIDKPEGKVLNPILCECVNRNRERRR